MEIKTKFDINQKVWFMLNNTPIYGYVTGFEVKNLGYVTLDAKAAKLQLGESIDMAGNKYTIEHDSYEDGVVSINYNVIFSGEDECVITTINESLLFTSKAEMRDTLFADDK